MIKKNAIKQTKIVTHFLSPFYLTLLVLYEHFIDLGLEGLSRISTTAT